MAKFVGKEEAIIYSTGFQVNLGVVSCVTGRGDYILWDELDHASIIEGRRLSFSTPVKYRHNDMQSLEDQLRNCNPDKVKLIVTDGVFSMEGDVANLPEIVRLAKQYNAAVMVDEAHVLLSNHNELGAEFLSQIQRRARKYNTGTIVITQQPTDFAAPNLIMHGKAIFDNASSYLIMNLRKQAVDDLSKLIDLNETEMERIKYYNQGEGLLICGNRRMNMTVIATQEELDSFRSDFSLIL